MAARSATDSTLTRSLLTPGGDGAAFVDPREEARALEDARLAALEAAQRDGYDGFASGGGLDAGIVDGTTGAGAGRRAGAAHPANDDARSLVSTFSLLSSATRRARGGVGGVGSHHASALTYSGFHEARRVAASPHARGLASAPAAGMLSGELRADLPQAGVLAAAGNESAEVAALIGSAALDPAGVLAAEAAKRQRAAQRAAFELFRVKWEGGHGAAARKEAALDAQILPEGKTWTRAEPRAWKVLRVGAGAPAPASASAGSGEPRRGLDF